jgi:hypothetical protein
LGEVGELFLKRGESVEEGVEGVGIVGGADTIENLGMGGNERRRVRGREEFSRERRTREILSSS